MTREISNLSKPPHAKRARKSSMADHAYDQLKMHVLNNEFTAGAHILEQDLSKRLKMSRTPLRQALIRLQDEELIEIVPRRGIRVVPMSRIDLIDIYEVLGALEAKATELLARSSHKVEIADVLAIKVDAMKSALNRGDMQEWAVADEQFHRTLFTLCNNRRLAICAFRYLDLSHRVRTFTATLRQKPTKSIQDLKKIVAAIRKGDDYKAKELHNMYAILWISEMNTLLERLNISQL